MFGERLIDRRHAEKYSSSRTQNLDALRRVECARQDRGSAQKDHGKQIQIPSTSMELGQDGKEGIVTYELGSDADVEVIDQRHARCLVHALGAAGRARSVDEVPQLVFITRVVSHASAGGLGNHVLVATRACVRPGVEFQEVQPPGIARAAPIESFGHGYMGGVVNNAADFGIAKNV